MIQYILECIAFQLVFLIIYDLFLKRETFFQWNRFYLIGTYIVSMILPWVKIEAMKTTVPESFQDYPAFLWNLDDTPVVLTAATEATSFSLAWEYMVLFGGMFLATAFFGYKLYQIYALKRKGEVRQFKDFTRIVVANSAMAFSFFKSIFLGDKVIAKEHQSIIEHELVHIRQRHSYDLLFFEVMRIVGWFNPLVYIYQRRVSELHEFVADAKVAKTDKKEQYEFLLSQVFQTQNISFINQFFKTSLIKKRIVMLQRNQSKKIWQLKYLLLVPMVFGMLAYTSSDAEEESTLSAQSSEDVALITKTNAKIDQDIKEKGGISYAYNSFFRNNNIASVEEILSKELFFEMQLLTQRFATTKHHDEISGTYFQLDSVKINRLIHRNTPSTVRYIEYVEGAKAFQILDPDLKVSVPKNFQNGGVTLRLMDENERYSNQFYVLEVKNVKDLTGDEVLAFNGKINEIFETKILKYQGLGLTDGQHSFEMFETNILNDSNEKSVYGLTKEKAKENYQVLYRDRKRLLEHTNEKNPIIQDLDEKLKELHAVVNEKIDFVIFDYVAEAPVFPGCEDVNDKRNCFNLAMDEHIKKHFYYPKEAQEKGIQGKFLVNFNITKEGDIDNIRTSGENELLENAAKDIFKRLPKMKPAKRKGKIINLSCAMIITFKLQNKSRQFQYNKEEDKFVNDKQLESTEEIMNLQTDPVPFATVDEVPVFPGCENENDKRKCFNEGIQKHIVKHFRYPKEAQEKGIQGKVYAQFTISRKGNIKNLHLRGPDSLLEQEVRRIVGKLPKMKPGKHKGKKVDVPFSIPITFKLKDDVNLDLEKLKLQPDKEMVPLVFIDGKESSLLELHTMSTAEIESMNVFKDKAAINSYGDKGKNGVIVVKTKKKLNYKSDIAIIPENGFNPIYFVDGIETSLKEAQKLDKNNIENINVLKDKVAIKKYGAKAKNGVVEITTRKQ